MNFFVPNYDVIDQETGKPLRIKVYQDIIEEQVSISYASNGSISFTDTDEMCPLDRAHVMNTLVKFKDIEKKAIEDAYNK